MLVRFVGLCRFMFTMLFCCFVMGLAYTDTAQAACEADEKFYNGVAQKALNLLDDQKDAAGNTVDGLVAKVAKYNDHLQQVIFNQSGPCYLLNMSINQSTVQEYGLSGFDVKGAALAGKEYKDDLINKLKSMDFSKIGLDLAAYDYKNDSRIAAANVGLKTTTDEQKRNQLLQDLALYRQCKAELFNLTQEQNNIKNLRSDVSLYLTTLSRPQTTTCTCDKDGILSACSTIAEAPQEESAKDMSCKNLNEMAEEMSFCPTCIIFERILMADQKLAGGAFGVLAGSLVKVLGIAFLIYLAYQTLLLVSAPSNQPMSKYLTSIAVQGFKVIVAVLILSNPSFLYDLVLKPILEGGLDFGITLTGASQDKILAAGAKYTKFNDTSSLLSAPFLQKMVGTADVFNEQAALMPAVGRSLICNAWENLDWNLFPNIEAFLEGILVVIFGYMISLSVGFYLLDITLELGFICCLLPFVIACWPFKITSRYTKIGWGIFMHTFFIYVMLGVIITTINAIAKSALTPGHDIQELVKALNENDFGFIKEAMEFGGSQLLFLIISCYICLKLLKDVNNLANKFAGGAGFNISPKIGTLAASTLFASGMNGGRTLFGAAASGVDSVATASGAKGAFKAAKDKTADTLGFTKMKNYYQQLKANAGIGANAKIRGGRDGGASTDDNQPTGDDA